MTKLDVAVAWAETFISVAEWYKSHPAEHYPLYQCREQLTAALEQMFAYD
jgi:hypothetical protein